ncbi:Olfactory receptor 51L1 [Plecturocebus cupreus]
MFYFLAMLSLTHTGMSISTLPTVLKIFWFDAREIETNACVVQMYFIHTFSLMESDVLLAMAFDRGLDCNPMLPNSLISFCHSCVLSRSYCLHQDVIRLACVDIAFNVLYGLSVVAFHWGIDSLGIFLSYAFILRSVLGIASHQGKLKALNICASHICAALILYVPMIGLSLVHCFAKHSSPIIHIIMANIYLLVHQYSTQKFIVSKQSKFTKVVIVELDCGLTVNSMSTSNSSTTLSSTFYLTGIPGYEEFHHWISIPFCLLYLVGIMGNCTILHIVRTDPRLHEPMYYFLAMLSLTDMGMSLPTMITLFRVLWSISKEIQFSICVVQMFFIHTFSFTESSVLLAMALDRSAIAMIPLLARLAFFPFCHSHILAHSYCLHQDMIRLACADTRFNVVYGLVLVTVLWGMDSLGILVSYVFIILSVLRIASHEGRLKALNTCASHICAVLILYVPMIGLSIIHRFAKYSSPIIHIFMAHIYLLVPPVLNPIIYSMKTQQIRQGILHLFFLKKISSTVK